MLVLAAAFFWGTSATLARYVFRDRHVPPLTVVELRLAIAASILGIWMAARRPASFSIRRADLGYFVVLGLFGVAAVQGSYFYSIAALGVGLAIMIQYLAPSLIVVYEVLRGAKLQPRVYATVVMALAGTILLVGSVDTTKLQATPLQWAIAFSSALSFAFYIVYSKHGFDRYRSETMLFYAFTIAAVFWSFVTPPPRIVQAGYDGTTWGMFLVIGVFSTLVPFACFYSGLRHLRAAEASIIATTEPVIASVSAALLLGEGLNALQWIGAALVLVAFLLSTVRPSGGDT